MRASGRICEAGSVKVALVWSEGRLLRLKGAPILRDNPALKPLSPVFVSLTGLFDSPFGKQRTPTEFANYLSLAVDVVKPQFLSGTFQRISPEKIAFLFNPGECL